MIIASLMEKLDQLSPEIQNQIEKDIDKLLAKEKVSFAGTGEPRVKFGDLKGFVNYIADDFDAGLSDDKSKLKREFGSLKGFVNYMADDFDEPLEEFKDYL